MRKERFSEHEICVESLRKIGHQVRFGVDARQASSCFFGIKKETRVVGMFGEKLLACLYGKYLYEDAKSATVVAVGSPWTKNGSQLIRPLISLFRTDRTNSAKQDDISHWAQPPRRPLAAG